MTVSFISVTTMLIVFGLNAVHIPILCLELIDGLHEIKKKAKNNGLHGWMVMLLCKINEY